MGIYFFGKYCLVLKCVGVLECGRLVRFTSKKCHIFMAGEPPAFQGVAGVEMAGEPPALQLQLNY